MGRARGEVERAPAPAYVRGSREAAMLRVTQDIVELRRWAESRGGRPCRDGASGRIALTFGDDACAFPVGWDEFEPTFCACRSVFVYDEAPGSRRHFLGPAEEAHAFVAQATGGAGARA
jgi:hypothetical protein